MQSWIFPLRNLSGFSEQVCFIRENFNLFSDPESFYKLILKCFYSPDSILESSAGNGLWVLKTSISLIKAHFQKKQGYGLAAISVDTGISESGKGEQLLRFILPKMIQRQELPEENIVKKIAFGISKRLQTCFGSTPDSLISVAGERLLDFVIKENLEDRLIPYRNFEPLLWLLETELKKQGKSYTPKKSYVGWINEYAELGKKVVTTPFLKVGNCLIHWKSVSDAGKGHKKKELAARARNTLYQYNNDLKCFARREGLKRLALIVDGTFNGEDLKILVQAGWDTIIYPDEIPAFVSSL